MNNSNKSIVFLLSSGTSKPVGGIKVVFEYANRFAKDGYDVTIINPSILYYGKINFMELLKVIPRYIKRKILRSSGKEWFDLDSRVKEKNVLTLDWLNIPKKQHIYVATACPTSYYLNKYPIPKENKFYLIQGFENWGHSNEYAYNSYRFGFRNIVISNWLADVVKRSDSPCTIIRNGYDFSYFKLTNTIEYRNRYSISMLYHPNPKKGCEYGLEALGRIRERYPQLKAVLFGVPPRPQNFPEWIEYYQTPDKDTHNKIYNESSVYLAPSLIEGWGLTVGEAMICGAAIVCTDTLGFQEMVENEKNGLIVEAADSKALEDAVIRMIEDDEFRIKLAKQGNQDIQAYSWDESYAKFKNLIEAG